MGKNTSIRSNRAEHEHRLRAKLTQAGAFDLLAAIDKGEITVAETHTEFRRRGKR